MIKTEQFETISVLHKAWRVDINAVGELHVHEQLECNEKMEKSAVVMYVFLGFPKFDSFSSGKEQLSMGNRLKHQGPR